MLLIVTHNYVLERNMLFKEVVSSCNAMAVLCSGLAKTHDAAKSRANEYI